MVLSPNDEELASSKKTYPIQDQSAQTIPFFRPQWSKLIPFFRQKRLKNHTLWSGTYLYSLYKEEPPGGGGEGVADYESRCLRKIRKWHHNSDDSTDIIFRLILSVLYFSLISSCVSHHPLWHLFFASQFQCKMICFHY